MTEEPIIEYFQFEEDFIEDNIRCIPMAVRLKLDTVGVKLTLKVWSRFNTSERTLLAAGACMTPPEQEAYKNILLGMIKKYSKEKIVFLNTAENADWNNSVRIPDPLIQKFIQFDQEITIERWRALSALQRFALIKLSRPGHESKNFGKAIAEFGLVKKNP